MAVSAKPESATYLTFTLGDEIFAVDVVKVREVLDFTSITKVPRTPEYMRGVINLRGSVVPVVDLRLKFGMSKTDETVDTCVIVLEIPLEGETTVIGAMVDSVREVFEMEPGEIEPAPRLGTHLDTAFIQGMGKHDNNFIIILDIQKVFSGKELDLTEAVREMSLSLEPEAIREEDARGASTEEPDRSRRKNQKVNRMEL